MTKSRSKTINRYVIKTYFQHAMKHRFYLLGLIISVVLFTLVFIFLPPLIIADILDKLETGTYVKDDLWGSFGPQLLLYVGVSLLGGVLLGRSMIYFVWKLEMNVLKDIYQRIFNHLLNQSANFHANRFGGSLVSQTNKFAGSYVRIVDTTVFQLIPLILSFIFTIVILAPRALNVAIFLTAFSLIFIAVSIRITKKVRILNAKEASAQTRLTGYLADAITNLLAVKSFSRSNFENKRFSKGTENVRQATQAVMRASISRDFFFSTATASLSSIALILSVAGVVLFDSDIATVFLVISYTGVISKNLWDFSQSTLRNYNRAFGDAEEMAMILQIEPEIQDSVSPEKLRISRGRIEFKDVVFTHSTKNETLFNKLSLQIKPGEKIGLVGHSGSGKTTLTKLLLRFSDINEGVIEIDSQDITKITQEDLRKSMAYVPQEPLMFHRSIAENIAYGNPEADERQIKAVAKMAHAHEFIEKLPEKYNTLVGERGVKLSGGQRQRVAIARAMIKNAPILVLDEATSALDSESEVLIQDALWKLMEGRTAIVIAHRLSTIQKMDRIIVLENGNITEQGTHKELIRSKGTYSELWGHQSGGFLDD